MINQVRRICRNDMGDDFIARHQHYDRSLIFQIASVDFFQLNPHIRFFSTGCFFQSRKYGDRNRCLRPVPNTNDDRCPIMVVFCPQFLFQFLKSVKSAVSHFAHFLDFPPAKHATVRVRIPLSRYGYFNLLILP